MNAQVVLEKIEKIENLPTIPSILRKILGIIEDPKVSLQKISDFVASDPTLTARILKMVNSPVYGFPGRISSVSHAMVILGLNAVKGLLIGVSVFEVMKKNMVGLWEHSLSSAIYARIIATRKNLSSPEEISVAALLHDIGKVILLIAFKEDYEKIIQSVMAKEGFLHELEKEYFGITHAEVGGFVAKKWNFPLKLTEPIMNHHRPQLSKNFELETAIVHFSNILSLSRGIGYSGDIFVNPVNVSVWNVLDFKYEDIKDIFREAEDPITSSQEIFASDE
ncbi:MAG: HDOD domain-containing protein [Thermodesulfovibrio sp.]|uniref:HDOD domain-containing protein n=1 Tax=unclassified Thermodesulfovibrio TaxID=2645936 RepID=UPI00083B27F1|nr:MULTISPECIES: HDOD domain-containing protein [unclassified Thermodesulfovibrio]MDI1471336.1 HDOD domain-containing protein [Thermodesulfovibrio sp. 1176]MDI6714647.1 HDOD domain-containing protein [Thermodesulfovibrio sp.]ODA43844.1 putative signal transduction protein [Thermodesulfovibrio sp. N1]